MASKLASVSIMWDWNVVPFIEADPPRMTAIRELFTTLQVDKYGRDAITHNKLWILKGNTSHNVRDFTILLTNLVPPSDIMHFSFEYD